MEAETKTSAYKQIQEGLRQNITTAVWPVGSMLPGRRDLARQFGVSTFTVERAINALIAEGLLRTDDRRGTFVVSPPASSFVADSAAHRPVSLPPYISAGTALTPAKAAPYTIGVIAALYNHRHSPEDEHLAMNDFWVRLLVHSLEHGFAEDGESTRFFNRVSSIDHSLLPLSETVEAAIAEGIDGVALICMGVPRSQVNQALDRLETAGIPVVCAWSGKLLRPIPHVYLDDHCAGYEAAEHLLRLGCRELFLFSPFEDGWQKHRWAGVQAAVQQVGLPPETVVVYPPEVPHYDSRVDPALLAYDAACTALDAGHRPTAIICANDSVAFGWMRAARERGWNAGQDYRILGFDDHPDSRVQNLTTMRPAGEAMGQEMTRLLRESLRGRCDRLEVSLRSRLIPRASTSSFSSSTTSPSPLSSLHRRTL